MKSGKMFRRSVLLVSLFVFKTGWSQTVFGKWKTIDDRNGMAKAIVEIYKEYISCESEFEEILGSGPILIDEDHKFHKEFKLNLKKSGSV